MRVHAAPLLAAALVCLAATPNKKLAVVHTAFAQSEDGPTVASDFQFVPGDTIFFSCLTEGYKKVPVDPKAPTVEKENVYLSYQLEVRDSRGVLLIPPQDGKVQTTVSPEDKDWLPKIRESFAVPPLADSGDYQVLVNVKDELAAVTVQSQIKFSVLGRTVDPSDTLVVRNFRFLRTEDDGKPLKIVAYRPGDPLWARFDMTGYKFGEHNQFDIEYGLTVLNSDGSVAYTEPQAATAKEQSFYPERYQPGVLSLNLAKDQPLGEYTIVLTVHDNLGQQSYETREKFSVE